MNISEIMTRVGIIGPKRQYQFHAKGILDGCEDLETMAASLESTAAWLRELWEQGVELEGTVTGDTANLVTTDQRVADHYSFQ